MAICPQRSHYFSFKAMMVLTMMLFTLKIIVGKVSNSMALLADSFHMVSDMAALVVGYFALRYSKLDGHDAKFSFGLARAEVLGALVNAIFLIAICFGVAVESLKRLVEPESIRSAYPVLVVGIVGVVFNAFGLVLFRWTRDRRLCHDGVHAGDPKAETLTAEDSDRPSLLRRRKHSQGLSSGHAKWAHEVSVPHELNIRTIYLHCFSHVLSSAIVILSAACTLLMHNGWVAYLDPVLSLVVIAIILRSCWPLLKESVILFMQSVPAGLKVRHLKEKIHREIPDVVDIHEMHVWQLAGHKLVGSAHIVFETAEQYKAATRSLVLLFKEEGIDYVTLQPEFRDCKSVGQPESNTRNGLCLLECSQGKKCKEKTCCTPQSIHADQFRITFVGDDACVTVDRETCL